MHVLTIGVPLLSACPVGFSNSSGAFSRFALTAKYVLSTLYGYETQKNSQINIFEQTHTGSQSQSETVG